MSQLHEWYTAFDRIPFRQKRFLVLKLADLAGTSDIHQLSFEVGNATLYTDDDDNLLEELADILYVHYVKMDSSQADLGGYVMAQLLTKLDRHPRYREIFVPRYEQLTGGAMSLALGEDIRAQVAALVALIPESRSGCRSNRSGSGRGC